ncbi:MAG: hypothetical protein JSV37_13335, partial [Anaerolineaceae bacterium]
MMSKLGILIGFYTNREDGIEAYRQLRRNRFRRACLMHKFPDENHAIRMLSARQFTFWGVILGLILGVLVGLMRIITKGTLGIVPDLSVLAVMGILGGLQGGLSARVFFDVFRLGIDEKLVQRTIR